MNGLMLYAELSLNWGMTLLVGVLCGLIAAGISVLIVVLLYARKVRSPIYPLDQFANLNLKERSDVFTGKTVTKVVISQNTNRKK